MPSRSVLQSLAYVNWTLLFSLALGALAVVAVLRWRTDATAGYLGFTAGCAAVFAALAVLLDGSLPPPPGLGIATPSAQVDQARHLGLVLFTFLLAAEAVAVRRRGGRWLGLAALGVGLLTASVAAFGWGADGPAALAILVELLILAAVTGGVLAAMILGHWYLVTPRLSEGPLILAVRLLLVALVVEAVAFAVSTTLGIASDRPLGAFSGQYAFLVWLLLGVGIVFPLVLTGMALRTARTRSMESATGLLYIDTAAVLAGTIVTAALLFGAGVAA